MPVSVRIGGRPAGMLDVSGRGELSFAYVPDWITAVEAGSDSAHLVSVRMPVRAGPFRDQVAGPFFDNLLPDAQGVREALGRYLHVDASDDYGLLAALGRDCPGAVSILPPSAPVVRDGDEPMTYEVLGEGRLAELVRSLPTRPLFVDADGELRLSLPGVQHKAAVVMVGKELALPHGQTPTSHILKVDIDGLPGSIRVENFCLRLAGRVGIDVPRSTVRVVDGLPFMLIARYDRALMERAGGRYLRRLHQEDFCQALGRFPREKYEKDGGPGWQECFSLMDMTGDPIRSRRALLERAVFQFLVGNPDAHAKNYSLVYKAGHLELSRLYDVNNAAAFRAHFKQTRPRLAMTVGGERDPTKLGASHWIAFAREVGIATSAVQATLHGMADRMVDACVQLRAEFRGTDQDAPALDLAVQDIVGRCRAVSAWPATQWRSPTIRKAKLEEGVGEPSVGMPRP